MSAVAMSSRSEGPSDEKENAIKAAAAGGLGLSTPEASGKLKGVDATASVNGKVAKFLEETRKVDTSTFKVETRREMYMLRYKDEKRTMRELAEEGASMVSMVLGESRGLRVRQNPRIMTQPKNDKPAHLGMSSMYEMRRKTRSRWKCWPGLISTASELPKE